MCVWMFKRGQRANKSFMNRRRRAAFNLAWNDPQMTHNVVFKHQSDIGIFTIQNYQSLAASIWSSTAFGSRWMPSLCFFLALVLHCKYNPIDYNELTCISTTLRKFEIKRASLDHYQHWALVCAPSPIDSSSHKAIVWEPVFLALPF